MLKLPRQKMFALCFSSRKKIACGIGLFENMLGYKETHSRNTERKACVYTGEWGEAALPTTWGSFYRYKKYMWKDACRV